MTKEQQPEVQVEYDAPWKQAIERFFPDFMRFFFPHIYDDINWDKAYEFMDKDLEKITPSILKSRLHEKQTLRKEFTSIGIGFGRNIKLMLPVW